MFSYVVTSLAKNFYFILNLFQGKKNSNIEIYAKHSNFLLERYIWINNQNYTKWTIALLFLVFVAEGKHSNGCKRISYSALY